MTLALANKRAPVSDAVAQDFDRAINSRSVGGTFKLPQPGDERLSWRDGFL